MRQVGHLLLSRHRPLQQLEPGTCFQPDVEDGELKEMYDTVQENFNASWVDYQRSGAKDDFWNFCRGDVCHRLVEVLDIEATSSSIICPLFQEHAHRFRSCPKSQYVIVY